MHRLRRIPVPGFSVHVGGSTAARADLADRAAGRLPLVITVVLLLSGAATGGVITAAATIMIGVFVAFIPHDDPTIKMFGLGMAVAIAVDATVVRGLHRPTVPPRGQVSRSGWHDGRHG